MAIQRCENGHAYDSTKHTSCPYCGIDGFDPGPTRAKKPDSNPTRQLDKERGTEPGSEGHTVPRDGGSSEGSEDQNRSGGERRTVGLMFKKKGIDPVVGWLVCTAGTDSGRDYRIRSGRNVIGRSRHMDICVSGDDSISRENHGAVAYDQKHNNFTLIPGDGRELIYLNGEAVYQPATLERHDKIEMGKTTFHFIPFCSDEFTW